MEVVGVVLGIIPLVISAAEHYRGIWERFNRYRKYDDAFRRFQCELRTQNSLYRTEVLLLLKRVFGHEQATRMLNDATCQLNTDADLDVRMKKYLDLNYQSCVDTVREIENLLKGIKLKEIYFAQAGSLLQNCKHLRLTSQPWRQRTGAKVTFAFSDASLDRDMAELRCLNETFRNLTSQADRLAATPRKAFALSKTNARKPSRSVKVHTAIQETSRLLYQTLSEACTKHTEHRTYLCLQPLIKQQSAIEIRYDISYDHDSPFAIQSPQSMHWVTVESFVTIDRTLKDKEQACCIMETARRDTAPSEAPKVVTKQISMSTGGNLRKRGVSPDLSMPCVRQTKSVRWQAEVLEERFFSATLTGSLPYFREHKDLCTRLINCTQPTSKEQRCPIGILERNAHYELMMFLAQPPVSCVPSSSVSFLNILQGLRDGHLEDLDRLEKLRFATLLATAALQFQSTPWLNNGMWRSEHLCLLGTDASSPESPLKLNIPYMDVIIKKSSEGHEPVFANSPWISNPTLFGLAILLIEIAYQRPFGSLCKDSDRNVGYRAVDAEFAAAVRLLDNLSKKLGLPYKKVVEKCLRWNFGDLTNRENQEQYHAEVVDVLQGLVEELEQLCLDD